MPIQIPIGAEEHFKGIVDLDPMKAMTFEGDKGKDITAKSPPSWRSTTKSGARR